MEDPAELFEAISHPVRIKILKILREESSSFAGMKRKLDIDSSGNLDYHLKKLGNLIIVRQDGLYGLSDMGKEALLSVEAIESWSEMKRRRIRIPPVIPREVLVLGLLEVLATFSAFWFLAISLEPSDWGYLPPVALLIGGLLAAFGIFTQQKSSWQLVLVKSALVFSMCLFLLNYVKTGTAPSNLTGIYFLVFAAAEAIIVVLALRHPVQNFLGIVDAGGISFLTAFASVLGIFSGILLIVLEMTLSSINLVDFAGIMGDVTVLAGLTVIIGGVLILLKSYIPGALLTILCALYPRPPEGLHAYDFITERWGQAGVYEPFTVLVAVVTGLLPIIAGAIALFIVMRKSRY